MDEDGRYLITRERLAAQILAVMHADFTYRPEPAEMREILKCVEAQIQMIERANSPTIASLRASPALDAPLRGRQGPAT
jgi:hypothetical protein